MRIRILENSQQVLFDQEDIGISLTTLRRGQVLNVESIQLYNGRYCHCYSGHHLNKIMFSDGTYYTLTDLHYEILT